jgi:hypothetical protein
MTNDQEWVDPSTPEQVTIMVITTAVEFACGFGLLALVIFGAIEVFTDTLTARGLVALPLSFMLTLLTGYQAMHLVVRPTRWGMARVLFSALVAILPIVMMEY